MSSMDYCGEVSLYYNWSCSFEEIEVNDLPVFLTCKKLIIFMKLVQCFIYVFGFDVKIRLDSLVLECIFIFFFFQLV